MGAHEASAPRRWFGRRVRWMLAAGAVVTPLSFGLGLISDLQLGGTEQWATPAVLLITLSALWRGPRLPRTAVFWAATVGLGLLCLIAALLVGRPFGSALWLVIANLVTALMCLRLYRSGLQHPTWEPRTPASLVTMLLACVAAALVAGVLGAYPGLDPNAGSIQPLAALWWSVRGFVALWVGCACFLMFWYWREPPVLKVRHPLLPVAIYATGVGAM